jgi:CheY-specific phosphatase CheX
MQASDFPPIVSECCAEVLDAMYFATVNSTIQTHGTPTAPEPDSLAFQLRFQGDIEGSFGLSLSLPTATTLAANFLGEEEDALSQQEIAEVAGELTNMLCGSFVSRIGGTKRFALSHPSRCTHETVFPTGLLSCLETDYGTLLTWVAVDSTTNAASGSETPILQVTL